MHLGDRFYIPKKRRDALSFQKCALTLFALGHLSSGVSRGARAMLPPPSLTKLANRIQGLTKASTSKTMGLEQQSNYTEHNETSLAWVMRRILLFTLAEKHLQSGFDEVWETRLLLSWPPAKLYAHINWHKCTLCYLWFKDTSVLHIWTSDGLEYRNYILW